MDEYGKENSTQKWIITGCVSVFVIAICCIAAVFGGLVWLGSMSTEGLAQIDVKAPTNVQQGQVYAITVEIKNISNDEITLYSVDIEENLLRGFIITSVKPTYLDTYDYGFGGETYQTYSFDARIPPGQSLIVTFEGEAVLNGDFSGDVDVCLNSSFNCYTGFIRTIVE